MESQPIIMAARRKAAESETAVARCIEASAKHCEASLSLIINSRESESETVEVLCRSRAILARK